MKYLILSLFIFSFSSTAQANQLSVYGNGNTRILNVSFDASAVGTSVGSLTLSALSKGANLGILTFVGTSRAIQEINQFKPKLVTIDSQEMRAYGWCYAVNGVVSEKAPDTVRINSLNDNVIWFYGYVAKKIGVWQAGCKAEPAVQNLISRR